MVTMEFRPSFLRKVMRQVAHRCFLLIAIAASASITACAVQPAGASADLGKVTSLALGQKVSVNGEPLEIDFAAVINDSRCPTGATCIWQGEASCRLEIKYKNTNETKIITEPGLTQQPTSANFADYELQFQLQPYPQTGKEIDKGAYRLQLAVVKVPPGPTK